MKRSFKSLCAGLLVPVATACAVEVGEAADDEVGLDVATLATQAPGRETWGPIYVSVLSPEEGSTPKVLDIQNWSVDNRGPAILWDLRATGGEPSKAANQRWVVEKLGTQNGNDVVRLINLNSHKCLDKSEDDGSSNGDKVYQFTCIEGARNQLWEFVRVGTSDWGMLKSFAAGRRCLDVTDFGFANGTRLQVWDCKGLWNQRWNIY